jgi:phosphoribosylaminoimidazole (AIR) synthetase
MLQKDGDIEEKIMYNTYNMGIGMLIAVDPAEADQAVKLIEAAGEKAYIIGETVNERRELPYVKAGCTGLGWRDEPAGTD